MAVIAGEFRFYHQIESVEEALAEEKRWTVFHDNDQDGLIASTILGDLVDADFVVWDRTEQVVFDAPTIYVDVRPEPWIIEEYVENETPFVVIDHHDPQNASIRAIRYLHPYLTRKLPVHPFKYNSGLLVWLLSKKDGRWELWVFLSHIFDKVVDVHTAGWVRKWLERYDREVIEQAIRLLGVPRFLGNHDYVRKLIQDCKDLECVLNDQRLLEGEKRIEEQIQLCVEKAEDLDSDVVIVDCGEVSSTAYISVATSTVSSQKPEKLVIGFGIYNDRAVFELRWQKTQVHLGRLARRLALSLGGSGGGHPPAAGFWVPKNRLKDALEYLQALKPQKHK